jgi:hypothetical protein
MKPELDNGTVPDGPMALVFIVELPVDLGIPGETRLPVWRRDAWPDWDVADWCAIAEVDPPGRADDARLEHLIVLRSVTVGGERPLRAADLAFGELDEEALPRAARRARRRNLRRLMTKPVPSRRTVAAIWRFVHDEKELLAEGDEQERQVRWSVWMVQAIAVLDAWLIALGIAADDPRLSPLSESDIGVSLPIVVATCSREAGIVPVGSLVVPTRGEASGTARTGDELELARTIFDEVMLRDGVFSVFYELVQQAGSARAAGRDRSAIIDYSTAGEVLITTVVDRVLALRGESAQRRERILEQPFANLVRDHLGRLLGVNSDPNEEEAISRLWWLHCYLRRNAIVHEGAGSNTVESDLARVALVVLASEIRTALLAEPLTSSFGEELLWGQVHGKTHEPPEAVA